MKKQSAYLLLFFSAIAVMDSAYSQGIVIAPGGNLVMNGASNLVVNNGSFSNAGTFIPANSTVIFTGTATSATTFVNAASATTFYNLGINKTSGSAKLLSNISISNSLLLTSGNFDLNGFDTDLGSTGSIIGESTSSFITGAVGGTIIRTVNLNAPTAFNPGNLGIEISSTANLGLTTIKRGEKQQVSGSGHGINRYYDFIPTNNSALNASLKMFYFDAELAGITESELKIWSLSTAPGSIWTLLGADAQDATANYVLKNGINQLHRFTLASSTNSPLPIQLTSFHAQLVNGKTKIDWSTSFELNSHHFDIEKSADGKSFFMMAATAAAGNANIVSNYSYTDANPFGGISYYRLKQVNADGSYTYSKIVAVNKGTYTNALINVYPNPTKGPVDIRFTSQDAAKVIVQITDIRGLLVISKEIITTVGLNNLTINMDKLAQGTYYLRVVGIDSKVSTIIKD